MLVRRNRPAGARARAARRGVWGPRLVIMVKEPVAGRVKTRLGRDIGVSRATGFARNAARALIARVAWNPKWRTYLGVGPDAALASRAWPLRLPRLAQGPGDLGRRMQQFMDVLPPGPVLIIGADIPAVRPGHLADAFRALGRNGAVFGPAGDGGYWLVGLKRFPRVPRAFGAVRWSSEHALTDTKSNLAGLAVADAAVLNDVDDVTDFRACADWAARRVLPDAVRSAAAPGARPRP